MKKRVLYVGGFEMPDGNAAAQRVLNIAKSIQENFYVKFLGLTHSDNFRGDADGFVYENLKYPVTKIEWMTHLAGSRELEYVMKEKPDVVIAYNYPALGLFRLQRYCKKNGIKLIGDITEWYHPHNVLKWIDTEWRMRILLKNLNGLIVISSFLARYYSNCRITRVPPTVDLQSPLWKNENQKGNKAFITLLYVGSPARGDKDKLDSMIDAITQYPNLLLKLVGITEEQYKQLYHRSEVPNNVLFAGRMPHVEAVKELKKADFSIFFRDPTRVNNAGFPTKYVESVAAGVPVITNHFSDLPEIVIQGKNGFIADNNPESVNKTVQMVANLSVGDLESMKQYCKEHRGNFDYRHYSMILNRFIESV